MWGVDTTTPLQLLKMRYEELDGLMRETESPEVACNINSLLIDYREAIKKLEA